MIKFIQHIALSCLKASELVEKRFHFRLSFREKLQLKMHLAMCGVCMKYARQSKLIEEGIATLHEIQTYSFDSKHLKRSIKKELSI
jgi:hypothetical protein